VSVRGPLAALVVVGGLLVGLAAPSFVGGGGGATVLPGVAPAAGGSPSFALRAGFVPQFAGSIGDERPSHAELSVDVVFDPPGNTSAVAGMHGGVSAATYAREFGLSSAALRSAEDYFAAEGLSVQPFAHDRLGLRLVGSAAELGAAFGTTLLAGLRGSTPVVFPATPPALPPWLEHEVAGVVGLSTGFDSFSNDLHPGVGPAVLSNTLITPSRARAIYGYSDLYNLTGGPSNVTGHAVAVVLWGAGYAPSDLASFFGSYYPSTFPAPDVVPYPVDNAPAPSASATSSPDLTAVEELTLDVEWAESTAPGATIDAVYTHDGPPPGYGPSVANLTDALETALSLANTSDLTAISMSFGSPDASDAALVSAWSPLFSEADRLGITLLAATGDTGGDTTVCSGTPDPQYPASADDVVAVGGTNVTITSIATPPTSFTESAWDRGGGGYASTGSPPSWQLVGSAAAPISAAGHRGMPDVSAAAADDFVYFNGAASSAGGTSFASPIWAGLVATIDAKWGHHLGFFTDRLYHIGAVEPSGSIGAGIADVVGSGNCIGAAVTGWDPATGWGSPRAAVLYADLLGSFVNLTVRVTPAPAAPGGSVTVTVRLTNRTSGSPIAGIPVALSIAPDVPTGPCSGTFATVEPTTDGSGLASAKLAIPFCYLGSHAIVLAQVATVHYFGQNSTRISVNLLGWVPQFGFLESAPWNYFAYAVILSAAISAGVVLGRTVGPPAPPALPPGASASTPSAPPSPVAPAPPATPPETRAPTDGDSAPAPAEPPAGGSPPSAGPPATGEPTVGGDEKS
jgi:kumamolisin